MSLNIVLTSIGLGCIVAVLAQTCLPLDGEFLTTAAIASAVLLLFTIKLPRLSRPVQGKH
jgi:uncharacterized membrane protein